MVTRLELQLPQSAFSPITYSYDMNKIYAAYVEKELMVDDNKYELDNRQLVNATKQLSLESNPNCICIKRGGCKMITADKVEYTYDQKPIEFDTNKHGGVSPF